MQSESPNAELSELAVQTKIFVIGFIIGAASGISFKKWLFPGINEFAMIAQCRTIFGIDTLTLLWYGLFAGIPFLALFIAISTLGRTSLEILLENRSSDNNHKSFKSVKIFRCKNAVYYGFMSVLLVVLLAIVMFWGIFQANKVSFTMKPRVGMCLIKPII